MNKFELFCMIYYVLDAEWDETKNKEIGNYLSGANPFLFSDIGSADPAVYDDFCKKISDPLTIENSYEKALVYIKSLNNSTITSAFLSVNQSEWQKCLNEYLFQKHKG
ncbi:MAG: hypothetical protein MR390_09530 [Oscillospiraceae bacterium]|nr:hypothetical protein [Oscillospiraceae bacterium]